MGEHKLHQQETKNSQKSSLKGTLISVFLVGFFIIFTWFSVYQIFVNRL
ncbi:cytochrome c oxidase subunit 2A [Bacillus pseudomycoides]|uniref:Cytochrome c oxidase subunit 2A n=1 Tax=Bacillus pseudomycoides TaxID=64104 RepID=A0AA91ZTP0_9BACI|nr:MULTISPECIES: cytochrome c oxidase subunit 2A [Bacillus]PEB52575.1 cytochrome c oxidase subunit 2A [Bacillus sp. AFS098217]PED83036.1 cytochrome c oxidase subunit 2A [Bacillus pseudomycoides]PEU13890.1 cytochrome c oxidase subunit 2A [Bacillus sp. AFS019443]PEU18890.1 cytochrome c oxidase subunit 2A [Bacillus sp. AFS014408]PFW63648.1 cytochrome c oxidase subunit 2A [Bacillus sp. AFS075034]